MRPSLGCPFEVVGSFTVLEGRVGCTGVSAGAGVMIGSSGVSVGFGRIPGVTLGAGVTDGVSGILRSAAGRCCGSIPVSICVSIRISIIVSRRDRSIAFADRHVRITWIFCHMVRLIRLILQFRRRCTIGFLCFLSVLLLIDSDSRLVPCLLLNFLIFKEIIRLVLQIGSLILFAVFCCSRRLSSSEAESWCSSAFSSFSNTTLFAWNLSSVGRCNPSPVYRQKPWLPFLPQSPEPPQWRFLLFSYQSFSLSTHAFL